MSGLPPPLPPARGARVWMSLPAMWPEACPSVPLRAPRWSLSPSSTMKNAALVNCFFLQPLRSSWRRDAGPSKSSTMFPPFSRSSARALSAIWAAAAVCAFLSALSAFVAASFVAISSLLSSAKESSAEMCEMMWSSAFTCFSFSLVWMSLAFWSAISALSSADFSARYASAASPHRASMRRTPEAMAPSDLILKRPMSEVLVTCAPPQSSMEYPSSAWVWPPIWTTLTRSPYLSPKNWVMSARSLTSVCGTSIQETVPFSEIAEFTFSSTASICSGVSAADEKSKRRRSGATIEPCWAASSETISWSAQWRRWVAVWWDSMLRRCGPSIARVTVSPTLMTAASDLFVRCAMASPILMTLFTGMSLRVPVSPCWPPIST